MVVAGWIDCPGRLCREMVDFRRVIVLLLHVWADGVTVDCVRRDPHNEVDRGTPVLPVTGASHCLAGQGSPLYACLVVKSLVAFSIIYSGQVAVRILRRLVCSLLAPVQRSRHLRVRLHKAVLLQQAQAGQDVRTILCEELDLFRSEIGGIDFLGRQGEVNSDCRPVSITLREAEAESRPDERTLLPCHPRRHRGDMPRSR